VTLRAGENVRLARRWPVASGPNAWSVSCQLLKASSRIVGRRRWMKPPPRLPQDETDHTVINHQTGSARAGSNELSVWKRFAGREAATITQSGSVWQALSTTAQTRRRASPSSQGVDRALVILSAGSENVLMPNSTRTSQCWPDCPEKGEERVGCGSDAASAMNLVYPGRWSGPEHQHEQDRGPSSVASSGTLRPGTPVSEASPGSR